MKREPKTPRPGHTQQYVRGAKFPIVSRKLLDGGSGIQFLQAGSFAAQAA